MEPTDQSDGPEADGLDERAREARTDLERHLAPEPPALTVVRTRVRRQHRQLAVTMAAIIAVVAVVAGVLVRRDDSSPRATGTAPLAVQLIRSDKPRAAGDAGAIPAAVQADTAFATDLYRRVAATEHGNFFLSPHSISTALAMTMAGADGRTLAQMQKVLHMSIPESAFHDAINALDHALTAPRKRGPDERGGKPLELVTANSLWGQSGYPFLRPFLDRLAESYAAGMNVVDFRQNAEASRVAINTWVTKHTGGKITNPIPAGAIDDLTRLVLVNTITFKASWVTKFDAARPGPFTTAAGKQVTAQLMSGGKGTYASGDGWQAAAIPYVGGAHLVAIMPDDLSRFEETVTPQLLDAAATGQQRANITLPKFSMQYTLSLGPALKSLGMTDAFNQNTADLSRMNGKKCPDQQCLYVAAVLHKATIDVDEKGTEAAAATAVVVAEPVSAEEHHEIVFNKPFMFVIRDDATGAILFSGRVTDPAS